MVELELDSETELALFRLAHEEDMTVNQYVEHILRLEMQKHGIEV